MVIPRWELHSTLWGWAESGLLLCCSWLCIHSIVHIGVKLIHHTVHYYITLVAAAPSPLLMRMCMVLLLPSPESQAGATLPLGTLSGQPPTLPSWLQPASNQGTQRSTAAQTLTQGAPQPTTTQTPAQGSSQTTSTQQAGHPSLPLRPFCNPSLPPIPPRLLKIIQAGGYIDLADLLPEALAEAFDRPSTKDGKEEPTPKRKITISTPLDWGVAYTTFAATATYYHPTKALQFITYGSIILRLAREVGGLTWLRYDKAFRQAAEINPSLPWDQRQPDIWLASLAGHTSLPPNSASTGESGVPPAKKPPNPSESCIRWNRGECNSRSCKYTHSCLVCHRTSHTARECAALQPGGWRALPRNPPMVGRDPRSAP